MHDVLGVGCRQAAGEIEGQDQSPFEVEGACLEYAVQGLPANQLHDDPIVALDVQDVVDLDDGRMVQASHRPGFPEEALASLSSLSRLGSDLLERYLPMEPIIVSSIDLAHPAGAETARDTVGTDLLRLAAGGG